MKMPTGGQGTRWRIVSAAILAALMAGASLPAHADSAATYKTKCAVCHGADGRGDSPAGKKMGAHDFRSPEDQKMTDDQLADIIANGKNKMPAYGKQLKPDEIKGLVAYVRQLASSK